MNLFMRFDEPYQPGPYIKNLKCFSVAMMGDRVRHDVDRGGKTSALDHLTRLHIEFPMLFKLVNKARNRTTHCGVLEFIADEGRCYLPFWMMRNLVVTEGELIQVEYVNLPVARFTKFQPQSTDFLEISNPKAVLENALRNFACLTKDDMISINYNEKDYELLVMETRPGNAVSIIECDMDVDFAAPVGYEEPTTAGGSSAALKKKPGTSSSASLTSQKHQQQQQQQVTTSGNKVGGGYRLDGKDITATSGRKRNEASISLTDMPMPMTSKAAAAGDAASAASNTTAAAIATATEVQENRGRPFYDYRIGLIRFHHNFDEFDNQMDIESEETKKANQQEMNKGQKLKHIGVKQI